jgi:hypothetical protein
MVAFELGKSAYASVTNTELPYFKTYLPSQYKPKHPKFMLQSSHFDSDGVLVKKKAQTVAEFQNEITKAISQITFWIPRRRRSIQCILHGVNCKL